ncbi:MAG: hypothetical protein K2Y35_01485 [Burkholderiales bacterium]|nr:hypothetical protein [Burkholderiales bacterium]
MNLLVFGVGNDSTFWRCLNAGGRTVFLEDNEEWMRLVKKRDPGVDARLVTYKTQIEDWRAGLLDTEIPDLDLPSDVRAQKWDGVIVDAPAGWAPGQPGRMKSIREAARLGRTGGHVFVHDCDREVERAYCDRYLRRERLAREIGRLRHYVL